MLFDLLNYNTLSSPTYSFNYKLLRRNALKILHYIHMKNTKSKCAFARKVSQKQLQQTTNEFFQQSTRTQREEDKKTKSKTESRLIFKTPRTGAQGCNPPHHIKKKNDDNSKNSKSNRKQRVRKWQEKWQREAKREDFLPVASDGDTLGGCVQSF